MTDPVAQAAWWMLGGAFAFATMGALTHALGARCDWLLVALVRIFLTFLFSVALARSAGARLVLWRPGTLWVRSLAGSCSLVCTFFALARLPVADVLTLTNTYPIWIVLFSWFRLRRAPAVWDALGVACGILGVTLIQQPHATGDNLAVAAALVASLATAVAMLGLHRLRNVDPRAVVAHFSGVATVITGSWIVLRGHVFTPEALSASSLLLFLGIGVTGTVGQVLLTRAYAAGVPTRVAMVSLTQVIFGMCYDVVIWHRPFTPAVLLGIVLVVVPAAWLTRGAGQALVAQADAADDQP
jgi:drug/metabolite transporter (DMT)-like permease